MLILLLWLNKIFFLVLLFRNIFFSHFKDVTNQDRCPTFMYHKGNRESVDCMDDIVLIQGNDVENDNTVQDVKVKKEKFCFSEKKRSFCLDNM